MRASGASQRTIGYTLLYPDVFKQRQEKLNADVKQSGAEYAKHLRSLEIAKEYSRARLFPSKRPPPSQDPRAYPNTPTKPPAGRAPRPYPPPPPYVPPTTPVFRPRSGSPPPFRPLRSPFEDLYRTTDSLIALARPLKYFYRPPPSKLPEADVPDLTEEQITKSAERLLDSPLPSFVLENPQVEFKPDDKKLALDTSIASETEEGRALASVLEITMRDHILGGEKTSVRQDEDGVLIVENQGAPIPICYLSPKLFSGQYEYSYIGTTATGYHVYIPKPDHRKAIKMRIDPQKAVPIVFDDREVFHSLSSSMMQSLNGSVVESRMPTPVDSPKGGMTPFETSFLFDEEEEDPVFARAEFQAPRPVVRESIPVRFVSKSPKGDMHTNCRYVELGQIQGHEAAVVLTNTVYNFQPEGIKEKIGEIAEQVLSERSISRDEVQAAVSARDVELEIEPKPKRSIFDDPPIDAVGPSIQEQLGEFRKEFPIEETKTIGELIETAGEESRRETEPEILYTPTKPVEAFVGPTIEEQRSPSMFETREAQIKANQDKAKRRSEEEEKLRGMTFGKYMGHIFEDDANPYKISRIIQNNYTYYYRGDAFSRPPNRNAQLFRTRRTSFSPGPNPTTRRIHIGRVGHLWCFATDSRVAIVQFIPRLMARGVDSVTIHELAYVPEPDPEFDNSIMDILMTKQRLAETKSDINSDSYRKGTRI